MAFSAKKAGDAVRELALEVAKMALQKAVLQPLGNAFGTMFSNLFSGGSGGGGIGSIFASIFAAKGAAFSTGGVPLTAFARGGVVNNPTLFGHAGGLGLMGEAGPEAILPLRRGPGGRLGVSAESGGSRRNITQHTTINISTPDVQGFRRSETQIAAAMQRMAARGRRNL